MGFAGASSSAGLQGHINAFYPRTASECDLHGDSLLGLDEIRKVGGDLHILQGSSLHHEIESRGLIEIERDAHDEGSVLPSRDPLDITDTVE